MLTRIRASPLTTTTRLSKLPPSLHAANCGGYLCTTDRWIRRATSELATPSKPRICSQANASATTLPGSPGEPKGERRYSLPGKNPHQNENHTQEPPPVTQSTHYQHNNTLAQKLRLPLPDQGKKNKNHTLSQITHRISLIQLTLISQPKHALRPFPRSQ